YTMSLPLPTPFLAVRQLSFCRRSSGSSSRTIRAPGALPASFSKTSRRGRRKCWRSRLLLPATSLTTRPRWIWRGNFNKYYSKSLLFTNLRVGDRQKSHEGSGKNACYDAHPNLSFMCAPCGRTKKPKVPDEPTYPNSAPPGPVFCPCLGDFWRWSPDQRPDRQRRGTASRRRAAECRVRP